MDICLSGIKIKPIAEPEFWIENSFEKIKPKLQTDSREQELQLLLNMFPVLKN